MLTRRSFLPLLFAPAIVKIANIMPVSSAKLTTRAADVMQLERGAFQTTYLNTAPIERVMFIQRRLTDDLLARLTGMDAVLGDRFAQLFLPDLADPITGEIGEIRGMTFKGQAGR
jgi:hypothetical protein